MSTISEGEKLEPESKPDVPVPVLAEPEIIIEKVVEKLSLTPSTDPPIPIPGTEIKDFIKFSETDVE